MELWASKSEGVGIVSLLFQSTVQTTAVDPYSKVVARPRNSTLWMKDHERMIRLSRLYLQAWHFIAAVQHGDLARRGCAAMGKAFRS